MTTLFNDVTGQVTGVFKKDAEGKGADKAAHTVTTERLTEDTPPPPSDLSNMTTSLWQHVKEKDWDGATLDLASSNAAEMAQTWHEKDLPLHVACRNHAPDGIIAGLVDAYPEAVRERSQKDNRLPLHLCVKNKGSYHAVGKIIRAYPEALEMRLDDKSLINKDTIRSAMVNFGVDSRVKKMINRSTDDWNVIVEWEKEQVESKERMGELQEELRATEAIVEKGERHDKVLAKRIKALTAMHEDYVKETNAKIDELTKAHEALIKDHETSNKAQKTRNEQLQSAIDAAASREVVTHATFDGYTKDLLRMYKKSVEVTEELRREVAELKSDDAGRKAVMNFN